MNLRILSANVLFLTSWFLACSSTSNQPVSELTGCGQLAACCNKITDVYVKEGCSSTALVYKGTSNGEEACKAYLPTYDPHCGGGAAGAGGTKDAGINNCDQLALCCAKMTDPAKQECSGSLNTYRGLPAGDVACASALAKYEASSGCGPISASVDASEGGSDVSAGGHSGAGGETSSGGYGAYGHGPAVDADWDGKWPTTCGNSGVDPGAHPGGSPECPDDLNLKDCPCDPEGAKAPCWTGERKNRNRGDCRDGETRCIRKNDQSLVWSECVDEVLPDPTAVTGGGACKCFTRGTWHIDNLAPCFYENGANGAASTIGSGPNVSCDKTAIPPTLPSQPWSNNTLLVDCAGRFKLCYTLKAGDKDNPSFSDCILGRVCVEADYSTPGSEQTMPPLPAWSSADSACAEKFVNVSGYGEMSVEGMSIECDAVQPKVFNRVEYCPLYCHASPAPDRPECESCGNGGDGQFGP